MVPPLSKEKVRLVRDLVASGMTRRQAAKASKVGYTSVCNYTRDLKKYYKGTPRIGQISINILNQLIDKGYFFFSQYEGCNFKYRLFKKHFPVKSAKIQGAKMMFLENRKEEALRAFVSQAGPFLQYARLKEISNIFGVELDSEMRKELRSRIDFNRSFRSTKYSNYKKMQKVKMGRLGE